MIRGVKFASIPVTDQDRAIAFYTEKMGFRLVTDQPFTDEQRWIELGIPGADTRVVLFRFDDSLKPGGQMNITFWSDDVEATARELKNKGVEFVMEPKRESWGTAAALRKAPTTSPRVRAELAIRRSTRLCYTSSRTLSSRIVFTILLPSEIGRAHV